MRMGARTEGAGFWLPSEFLADDDFLMDKENFNTANTDHLLQKLRATSTSGSPNGAPSIAPKYGGVGDLIFLAAGCVLELKLNRGYAVHPSPPQRKIPSRSAYVNTQYVGGRSSRVGLFSGGAAAKKTYAGTGVFLPRRYDNISDSNTYLSVSPGCSSSQGRASIKCSYESQLQPQPNFVSNRNSVTPVLKVSSMIGRGLPCLPGEWTY